LISSNQRSFNSRAAATNRGSFFVTFFSLTSTFSSITEGTTAPNRNPPDDIAEGFTTTNCFLGFCARLPGNAFTSLAPISARGNTIGFASLQCVPGGIGSTIRFSRIAPLDVSLGNHHGVVSSPWRIRFCQKICILAGFFPFPVPPLRNANGTKPIASQNLFAAKSCAHQQQYSLHP
jgi:hypothetical protein